MEQKPKPGDQVKPGSKEDKLNGILGSNQEAMRIDTNVTKAPETCATNSSFKEVYFCKFWYVRAIHMARLHQMNLEDKINTET